MSDKYTATWISHTSLKDFLTCPRAYYLKNIYKDPSTGHKVQIMSPPLALGSAVHDVVESLSIIPTEQRFSESLITKFDKAWQKVTGKMGGFTNPEVEARYKARGEEMIKRVMKNPGPVATLAVKIKEDLPHYWLSEEDQIILCGKIDWLEFYPDINAVHIIDFKTGKNEEDGNSLQLPIYLLLAHNTQKRKVVKASYWYLALSDELVEKPLPNLEAAYEEVLELAKKVKLARKLEIFKCSEDGCRACEPHERIIKGEGGYVGQNAYKQDIYIFNSEVPEDEESIVL